MVEPRAPLATREASESDGGKDSGDDAQDMAEKSDAFAERYEEELRERYEGFQHRTTEC